MARRGLCRHSGGVLRMIYKPNDMNFELIGTIIAVIGIVVSIWKIQRDNIREFQKISDKAENNELKVADIRKDIETMINDRTRIVTDVYAKMEKIERIHAADIKETSRLITENIETVRCSEQRRHDEIIIRLDTLNANVATLTGEWSEYKRTHNGTSRTRKTV
jgi:sensor domain CHASE-containing protein